MSVYELFILSILMHFPLHAYMIAKIAGPWEKISRGTLSTILAKLEKAGLIEEADPASVPFPSERSSRTYAITERGRARFIELMLDPQEGSNQYVKLFHLKSAHLEFLPPAQRIGLVKHFIAYCHNGLLDLERQLTEFATNPEPEGKAPSAYFYEAVQGLLEMKLQQMRLELAWGERLAAALQEEGE